LSKSVHHVSFGMFFSSPSNLLPGGLSAVRTYMLSRSSHHFFPLNIFHCHLEQYNGRKARSGRAQREQGGRGDGKQVLHSLCWWLQVLKYNSSTWYNCCPRTHNKHITCARKSHTWKQARRNTHTNRNLLARKSSHWHQSLTLSQPKAQLMYYSSVSEWAMMNAVPPSHKAGLVLRR